VKKQLCHHFITKWDEMERIQTPLFYRGGRLYGAVCKLNIVFVPIRMDHLHMWGIHQHVRYGILIVLSVLNKFRVGKNIERYVFFLYNFFKEAIFLSFFASKRIFMRGFQEECFLNR
jgi:hypothetical protein